MTRDKRIKNTPRVDDSDAPFFYTRKNNTTNNNKNTTQTQNKKYFLDKTDTHARETKRNKTKRNKNLSIRLTFLSRDKIAVPPMIATTCKYSRTLQIQRSKIKQTNKEHK